MGEKYETKDSFEISEDDNIFKKTLEYRKIIEGTMR